MQHRYRGSAGFPQLPSCLPLCGVCSELLGRRNRFCASTVPPHFRQDTSLVVPQRWIQQGRVCGFCLTSVHLSICQALTLWAICNPFSSEKPRIVTLYDWLFCLLLWWNTLSMCKVEGHPFCSIESVLLEMHKSCWFTYFKLHWDCTFRLSPPKALSKPLMQDIFCHKNKNLLVTSENIKTTFILLADIIQNTRKIFSFVFFRVWKYNHTLYIVNVLYLSEQVYNGIKFSSADKRFDCHCYPIIFLAACSWHSFSWLILSIWL